MSNPNPADKEVAQSSNNNRRAFLRGMSAVGLSAVGVIAMTNPVSASGRSDYNKKAREVFKFNKELYGAKEAKILTDKLVKIDQNGLIENVGEKERKKVFNEFTNYLINNTDRIATDIRNNKQNNGNRGQYSKENIPGNGHNNNTNLGSNSEDRLTYLSGTSGVTKLSTNLSTTITDDNTSGSGGTETRFLDDDTRMEARCVSSGYGNATAWVERAGHYYPSSSGEYEVTCDFERKGAVSSDGSATIRLFVEELGGNRRNERVDTGATDGSVTRSQEFALSGETDYIVGLHLNTEIQGYGYSLYSDYYSSTRGIAINSLSIDEIYTV